MRFLIFFTAYLTTLLLHNNEVIVVATGTDKAPVSLGRIKLSSRPVLAGAAAIGLIAGKRVVDGPKFDERVSLAGKTVVITGGNTGLGKETAVKLAALGANTIILCKSPVRAADAVEEIVSRSSSSGSSSRDRVRSLQLDLADLNSVQKCATALRSTVDKIDVLVNNAGVMAIPQRELTADGFEKHLGINHLGHFALTGQLLPLLLQQQQQSSGSNRNSGDVARIVSVSSAAHLLAQLDTSDLMLQQPQAYGPWRAYGNSKLANILFTRELSTRLQQQQQQQQKSQSTTISTTTAAAAVSVCCHPGGCRTELGRYIVDPASIPQYLLPVLGVAAAPLLYFTKSSEEGAQTQIFLAASQRITAADSGKYFDNSAPASTSTEAQSAELSRWLWQESERLTGVKYNFA